MTALEELIYKYIGGIDNCTPCFRKNIEKALQKEKEDLEYFFNCNDYNSNFLNFEEQYKALRNGKICK